MRPTVEIARATGDEQAHSRVVNYSHAQALAATGQITIPADVRRSLKVEAGDRVEFVEIDVGRFELLAATGSVKQLKGMFGKAVKSVSVEEMNKGIAARGRSAA